MSGDDPRLRTEYRSPGLELEALDLDPVRQWKTWLAAALDAGLTEPHAACLSTVGPEGRPSARMVLVRALDDRTLGFFTNYGSRKGRELAANPHACLTFYWPALHRQVRVEGMTEKTSDTESERYFASRPYESQVASSASPQSTVIERGALESRVAELKAEFPDDVPRPPHWGGYRLQPDGFEFWQGQPARLHDRFRYTLKDGLWAIDRLAP